MVLPYGQEFEKVAPGVRAPPDGKKVDDLKEESGLPVAGRMHGLDEPL
jgi:hypothetical protein